MVILLTAGHEDYEPWAQSRFSSNQRDLDRPRRPSEREALMMICYFRQVYQEPVRVSNEVDQRFRGTRRRRWRNAERCRPNEFTRRGPSYFSVGLYSGSLTTFAPKWKPIPRWKVCQTVWLPRRIQQNSFSCGRGKGFGQFICARLFLTASPYNSYFTFNIF